MLPTLFPLITNTQIRTLFINVLTAIGMAIVLEFFLSLGLKNPDTIPDLLLPYYRSYYANSDRNIFQVTECAEYDPNFYYRFKPGTCSFENREFNVVNHFNSAGLRDDERSLDNPSVIVFGDSFTQGWGVTQTESFPEVLEALSQQTVLNAGVSSFGTAREVKLLNKLDINYVRTVIFQYHPNDYEENLQSIENNFILPISPRRLYDSIKENIADRNRYYPFKYLAGISKSAILSTLRPNDKVENDTLEARAFLDILVNSNIMYIASRIVVFKIDTGENNNRFVDALDQLLKEERYSGLNILTVRLDGVLTKEDYFILDSHINARGHAKLARLLWDHMNTTITPVVADKVSVSNPLPDSNQ